MRTVVLALGLAQYILALSEAPVSRIVDLVDESCVVLVRSTAAKETLEIVQELSTSIFEPNSIPVLVSNWQDFFNEKYVKLEVPGLSETSDLVVLDRKLPDRSCLLKVGLLHTRLSGTAFVGLKTLENILKFVNRGCNTHWNLDGTLNRQGIRRRAILDNLYSVKDDKECLSMRDLTQSCADLTQFFRTGQCTTERDFCSAEETCLSPELPTCERIRHLPSWEEFLEKYLARGKPVILEGAVKSWPAFKSWSNQFFREKFGNNEVHVKLTPPEGEFEGVEPRSLWNESKLEIPQAVTEQIQFPDLIMVRPEGINMKMVEFMDLVENKTEESGKSSAYLEYTPIADYMKGLENDVKEFDFVKNMLHLQLLNIWLSDGNTLGKLHMDQFDNFLCQIRGWKQVIMFEPWDNRNFYEGHILEGMLRFHKGEFLRDRLLESTALTMAPADITKPDFKKFPNFANTYPVNCTIGDGDVLYLPSFWWHEVQSYPNQKEKRNLAVNFWYEPFLLKEYPCAECKFDVNPKYRDLL